MITRLDLRHFKCFRELHLPLGPLTLLSGANASGKSAVMHALALLHQTMREHTWSTRLLLNGESVMLGEVSDVVDQVYGRRACEIGLAFAGGEYRWRLRGEPSWMSMEVLSVRIDGDDFDTPKVLVHLLPGGDQSVAMGQRSTALVDHLVRLTYLTAERIGPKDVYRLRDPINTPFVGPHGEDAVSVLYLGRDEEVLVDLRLPNVPRTRLWQIVGWMNHFFPGFRLSISKIPHANAVTLGLRTSDAGDFHRPINTGFGLTQVLPLVVAAVSARRGDMLLIENPEVHLHPAGQSAMGGFLARAAAAGVQVIVETHSDHILNGIRRAVREGVVAPDAVLMHFFRPRDDGKRGTKAQIESIGMDGAGMVDAWPDGFFDQFDKDSTYFAGW